MCACLLASAFEIYWDSMRLLGWILWRCSSLVQRLLLTICEFWNPSQSLTKVCLGIHHFSRIHSSYLVQFCFLTLFSARLGCRGSQIVRPEQFCIPALFGRLSHSHEQITFSCLFWSPAEGILTDRVERSLAGETVQVPLVLQHHLARIVLIEAHQRLACLPTPLLPEMFKLTLQKQLWKNLLRGKGMFFSSCLALLARVSSLNCSSVLSATIFSTLTKESLAMAWPIERLKSEMFESELLEPSLSGEWWPLLLLTGSDYRTVSHNLTMIFF